jgi:hypothetical protein
MHVCFKHMPHLKTCNRCKLKARLKGGVSAARLPGM